MKHRVAIVGAGVSGLTCGILFAERGYRTATFAEKTGQRTTSAAAAAIWYPYDAEPIDKVIAWALETYKVLVDLSCKRNTGVSMIELRTFSRRADIQIPEWAIPLAASVIPTELENTASRERRRIDCGSGSRPGRSGETGERLGRARVKSLTIPVTFLSIGKSKRCLDSARHDSETLAPQSVLLELELCGEAKTISIARGAADSP